MKKLFRVRSVVVIFLIFFAKGPVAKAQISGSDDFNDNSRDSLKWGPIDYPTGNGQLFETNQRLEYRVTSPDLVEGDEAERPWILNRPANSTDWEVVLDVVNSATPAVVDRVATCGIEVFNASDLTDFVYAELYASTLNFLPLRRGFKSGLVVNGVDLVDRSTLGDSGQVNVTGGSVRLRFDSATKVFNAFYDADGRVNGYTWRKFASFGISGSGGATTNANWGMSGNADFQVALYGYSEGMIVSSGMVYGDNFFGQTAPASRPSLGIVAFDNLVQLRWLSSALAYELEASQTLLSNSWSAVTNPPTTIDGTNIVQLPVSGPQQFFQLRK